MIRVVLPAHLRNLARVGDEVMVHVDGAVTQRSVLDALEAEYPVLRGTIRDQATQKRRPFLRFFACEEDLSPQPAGGDEVRKLFPVTGFREQRRASRK
jgi:molybdopterin synthase sulfur carrier subunit